MWPFVEGASNFAQTETERGIALTRRGAPHVQGGRWGAPDHGAKRRVCEERACARVGVRTRNGALRAMGGVPRALGWGAARFRGGALRAPTWGAVGGMGAGRRAAGRNARYRAGGAQRALRAGRRGRTAVGGKGGFCARQGQQSFWSGWSSRALVRALCTPKGGAPCARAQGGRRARHGRGVGQGRGAARAGVGRSAAHATRRGVVVGASWERGDGGSSAVPHFTRVSRRARYGAARAGGRGVAHT